MQGIAPCAKRFEFVFQESVGSVEGFKREWELVSFLFQKDHILTAKWRLEGAKPEAGDRIWCCCDNPGGDNRIVSIRQWDQWQRNERIQDKCLISRALWFMDWGVEVGWRAESRTRAGVSSWASGWFGDRVHKEEEEESEKGRQCWHVYYELPTACPRGNVQYEARLLEFSLFIKSDPKAVRGL